MGRMRAPGRLSPLTARLRRWALVAAMLVTIAGIAAMRVVEERAESEGARDDMIRQQRVLAEVLAAELRAGVADLAGADLVASPRAILHGHAFLEGDDHRLLLAAGDGSGLRTLDGEPVALPRLVDAVAEGDASTVLLPAEAAALGLPESLAVAGFARVDAGGLGRWTVIVVSSALHQQQREARRSRRVIVGFVLVSLVVLGFGVVAFRTQRHEFALTQALAREELRTRMEEQLAREGRAATMLTFAAGMAHEVSTPLGIIGMRAEQLAGHAEDGRAERAARVILEQVVRIRELVKRFLLLARGGAPQRERFQAQEILVEAAARVRHRFERAGVELRAAPEGAGVWLRGDAQLLEHALTNLLLNACDASPRGGVVDLRARASAGELTIEVRDHGAGIDPALAHRVPEPFLSTKADGEGTGLGLAIAHEVARMHRGHLALHPADGGGTSAVLRLPTAPKEPDDHVDTDEAPHARPAGR